MPRGAPPEGADQSVKYIVDYLGDLVATLRFSIGANAVNCMLTFCPPGVPAVPV